MRSAYLGWIAAPATGGERWGMSIRVLTVDDHPVVRAGVSALIRRESDMQVVAEAADGEEAVTMCERYRPDVVLMDLRLPKLNGVDALRIIRERNPSARIVALTTYDGDYDIFRALSAGASGYLLKDSIGSDVVQAVRMAAAGWQVVPPSVSNRLGEFAPRADLTRKEWEVLRLTGKGFRNRDIARLIGRSVETVKAHLRSIMRKLDVEDRTEAVAVALQRGIIHLDD
jgi:DNA-binding NarL/FixJ family response regulator